MPQIHSSMLYAAAGDLVTYVIPWGCPGPLALVLFFHNSIHNGLVTFLYSIYGHLYLSCPTSPIDGACQAESYIPGISQGESFLE